MDTTVVSHSPQIVGQAVRAHQPLLDRILRRTGTSISHWVALKLTHADGPPSATSSPTESLTR
jgi:hypothetical protein